MFIHVTVNPDSMYNMKLTSGGPREDICHPPPLIILLAIHLSTYGLLVLILFLLLVLYISDSS